METEYDNELQLSAIIGLKGDIIDGLILHPDNEHMIYAQGSTIIVRHIISRTQHFLRGHDHTISVLSVSESGRYLASGQTSPIGFIAEAIVWDMENLALMHKLKLHKVSVKGVSFSENEECLATLGGVHDNVLAIWNVRNGKMIAGSTAGTESVNGVKFYNTTSDTLLTIQNNGVRIWKLDVENRKMESTPVNMGKIKRIITNVHLDASDTYAYCSTRTGDILEIHLDKAVYKRVGPMGKIFNQGINCITMILNGDIIIGTGEGTVCTIDHKTMKIKKTTELTGGGITSITLTADGLYMFIATAYSNIYWVDTGLAHPELRNTSHYMPINHIAFPRNMSEVFATCSLDDIRIWNIRTRHEILRIIVPGIECLFVSFMPNGKYILSGWNDGKIRSFLPQSGKLLYVINDAHTNGVSVLFATSDNVRIISGGMEGDIRLWKIGKQTQNMIVSLSAHTSRVNDMKLNNTEDQLISASSDGTCIIWDLNKYMKIMTLSEANTLFKQVIYHPDELQIVTSLSDGKLIYWDKDEGNPLRIIECANEGEVNTLAIASDGEYLITGSADRLIKLWDYDQGTPLFCGIAHSTPIIKLAISPDEKNIVSVGGEGAIYIWNMPTKLDRANAGVRILTPKF